MAEVQINNKFFEDLGRSPEVTRLCVEAAEKIAAAARATAPVDSGDYRRGIRVEVVARAHRNVALVVGADPKTMLIESTTGNLARSLNQVKRNG